MPSYEDPGVAAALAIGPGSSARERTVDITTTGRRSGTPHRIETWFYRADGVVYLSGMPGRRDWAANLRAHPEFTFHLKHGVEADLPARATEVTDEAERRRVVAAFVADLKRTQINLDDWVAGSPLFAVRFDSVDAG